MALAFFEKINDNGSSWLMKLGQDKVLLAAVWMEIRTGGKVLSEFNPFITAVTRFRKNVVTKCMNVLINV